SEMCIRDRFGFGLVASAGFLDGINPCALATLVLFLTMLSCYRARWDEVVVCTLVFAGAVFLTYFGLGVGLLQGMRFVTRMHAAAMVLHWGMVVMCGVCAVLSVRDGCVVWRKGDERDAMLGLPASWRERIARLLGAHVGRRRWLVGVFGVGIIVSLLESICTGQVYVPTLAYVVRTTSERWRGLGLLALYNVMFIMPLLGLGGAVALGVRSQWIMEWQKRHAVASRLMMAALFATLGTVLVVTGK
ncbi:MAG: hypothetical protein N2595_07755, partial [bacterium]|nr:hypothetical protein [bacterium]